jgi:hypothetical protein
MSLTNIYFGRAILLHPSVFNAIHRNDTRVAIIQPARFSSTSTYLLTTSTTSSN